MTRQATRPASIQIAVRDESANTRHPQLTAVGVARHDEVSSIAGHRIKHSQVWGVRNAEREIGRLEWPGNGCIVITGNMWIINSPHCDCAASNRDEFLTVAQMRPT